MNWLGKLCFNTKVQKFIGFMRDWNCKVECQQKPGQPRSHSFSHRHITWPVLLAISLCHLRFCVLPQRLPFSSLSSSSVCDNWQESVSAEILSQPIQLWNSCSQGDRGTCPLHAHLACGRVFKEGKVQQAWQGETEKNPRCKKSLPRACDWVHQS